MQRTQLYLTHEQRRRLDALARAAGTSMADVVREAVETYLAGRQSRPRREDALFDLVGAGKGLDRATDVSSRHHHYLATPHWKRRDA